MQLKFKHFVICSFSLLCFFSITSATLIPYELSGYVTGNISGSVMISNVPNIPYHDFPEFFSFDLSQFNLYIDNVKIYDNASGSMGFCLYPSGNVWGEGIVLEGEIFGLESNGPLGTWNELNCNGIPLIPEQFRWDILNKIGDQNSGYGVMTFTRSVPEPSVFPLLLIGFLGCCGLFRKKKEIN